MRHFTIEEQNFIKESANKHMGYKYVANILNCHPQVIKKYCITHNIEMIYKRKNHNLNENYFEHIDTSEKAYFLGLIYTDGNVRVFNEKSKQLRLSLQLRDQHIIEKLKEILQADCNLIYDKRPNKEMVSIEISNCKIVDDLINHGVVPNKTYVSTSLPKVPENFEIDFLRGLFDGDGTLSYKENYNESCVGFTNYSESVVKEFQQKIDSLIGKESSNKIHYNDDNGHRYTCHWRGRRQVLKILSVLYDNSVIFLQRKYDKYQRLLSTTDKDII